MKKKEEHHFSLTLQQDVLVRRTLAEARKANQSRQVSRRLRDLLPSRLREIKNRQAHDISRGKAERLAFCSPEYAAAIGEYLDIFEATTRAQVQYETGMMLVDARRTLRAFHKFSTR